MMPDTNHNQIAVNILRPRQFSAFTIFSKPWFFEGLFYSTFLALIWTNEEPSKLNTLCAAWSAYAIVAFAMYQGIKSGTIINPLKWIRIYFIQSILFFLVCDFIWLQGHVARGTNNYDPIRFDYYAAILASSGFDFGVSAITLINSTGTVWYAACVYWIFGISKYYVVLFNGAFLFVTWILFANIMGRIEGNPLRWQWLRFGALLPDFIIHFTNVSKEPLSTLIVALGIWMIARSDSIKGGFVKLLVILTPLLVVGLAVRNIVPVIIIIVACIWFWESSSRMGKIKAAFFLGAVIISGQVITSYVGAITGSMSVEWSGVASTVLDPETRLRENIRYRPHSWNLLLESLPIYFMPIVAPVKGLFMMIAPPFWKVDLVNIVRAVISDSRSGSGSVHVLFQATNALLFFLSFPLLMAASVDVFKSNRMLWTRFSLTLLILISFMGFAVYGIIEPRYRPMLLPLWLSVCGIGYYYGNPRRYILPVMSISVLCIVIYYIPKMF